MDRIISASEANQRFSQVLREVAAGDSYTVTSRGRTVAHIVPPRDQDRRAAQQRLWALLETLPIRYSGSWTREDLYD